MSDLLKKIENEALDLSVQERAFLADRLLSSLNESPLSDIDIAWLDEAERRYQEYQKGLRPGIPAHEVFSDDERLIAK